MTSPGLNVISLLLHDVTDHPDSSGFLQPTARRYKHTVRQFAEYLAVIADSGLPVQCSVDTATSESPSVVLTFDDGGASAPTAADMLEEHGWRGVFFVTTDLIGTRGFLDGSRIEDLHRRGHLIGSHSCSHPDVFRELSRRAMREEWVQSRDVLQEILGTEVLAASVPGGDISPATIEEAEAAGYRHIFTSEQLTRPWKSANATCYGRLMMVDTTSPATLRRWLRHPTLGVLPERVLRFTKTGIKRLMGSVYVRMIERRRALHEQQ